MIRETAEAPAATATSASTSPASYFRDLRAAYDPTLQRALVSYLNQLDLMDAVRDERLSVALVDVTDLNHPRMAEVNGDQMFYAASLPKIAILLGAFQKAAEGKLRMDSNMREQMTDMIRFSSNNAATYVLNRVGRSYVTTVLQSSRYRLYDLAQNGGLWVGKAYANGGAYQRDPLHNISHGATAYQVARFYYMLETGRLVSPQASREMKEIMGSPGIHHKFVAGLEEVHPDAQIFRKSGTWGTAHADSAIVERDGRRYIAVALADDRHGGDWMRELIVAMDDIVSSRHSPGMLQATAAGS